MWLRVACKFRRRAELGGDKTPAEPSSLSEFRTSDGSPAFSILFHSDLIICFKVLTSHTFMSAAMNLDRLSFVVSAVVALVAYYIIVAIYRLTFHPLAKIPGPKLAAVSLLYQTYYSTRNGRSIFYAQIALLHKQYGKWILDSSMWPMRYHLPK